MAAHPFAVLALLLSAGLLAQPNQQPSFAGQYESGPRSNLPTHLVIVTETQTGYEVQWQRLEDGRLEWVGVIARDEVGRWIETYPPDRSPHGSSPYEWITDGKQQPEACVRDSSRWFLKRVMD